MSQNIIVTSALSRHESGYPQGHIFDYEQLDEFIIYLQGKDVSSITIYDRTKNSNYPENEIFHVNDHINCSGLNQLIGRQKALGIDFVDMTNIYEKKDNGIIAESWGENFSANHLYPSTYLAHISILARALGFKKITGKLINKL